MLVQVDASQLEWRTLVELARDPVAMEEISKGLDTHSLNQKAFELPSRLISKIYLFRTIYRGSGWAFANDPAFMHVSKDPKFWDNVGEKFYRKYNVIDSTHLAWSQKVVGGLPIIGPFGRVWDIGMSTDKYGNSKIPWTVLTNYPVQGTGADVMMIARISFYRRLKSLGVPALVVSTVHDSIVVDVEAQYISQIANLFYQVFDDLVVNIRRTFKYDWQVPLGCEVKAGMNMKEMFGVDRTDKL